MARRPRFNAKQIIEALEKNGGMVTYAAKALGCHYHTVMNAIRTDKKVAAAYEEIKERVLDIAENRIEQDIINGNVETAKWYVRYKGKHRGYVDKENSDFTEASLITDIPMSKEARTLGLQYLRSLKNAKD